MRFQDMPNGTRGRWVAWARSHDWGADDGCNAYYDASTGEMVTFAAEHDGQEWRTVEARHTTPSDMRGWAGY